MIVKKHLGPDGKMILAVCDKDTLGNEYEEGKAYLDMTSEFYKGEERSEDEVKELMAKAYTMNIVGKDSVALAKKEGYVDKENISTISDVPHAQVVIES